MPSVSTVTYTAALKLSVNIRQVIHKNNNKLYISLNRCNVYDRFHVVQCYHCQEPGHLSKNCPVKKDGLASTCFYCAGDHQSKDCENKGQVRCVNCSKSSNPEFQKGARTHTAASRKCPIMQHYMNNIKNKTVDWSGKNLMA